MWQVNEARIHPQQPELYTLETQHHLKLLFTKTRFLRARGQK